MILTMQFGAGPQDLERCTEKVQLPCLQGRRVLTRKVAGYTRWTRLRERKRTITEPNKRQPRSARARPIPHRCRPQWPKREGVTSSWKPCASPLPSQGHSVGAGSFSDLNRALTEGGEFSMSGWFHLEVAHFTSARIPSARISGVTPSHCAQRGRTGNTGRTVS